MVGRAVEDGMRHVVFCEIAQESWWTILTIINLWKPKTKTLDAGMFCFAGSQSQICVSLWHILCYKIQNECFLRMTTFAVCIELCNCLPKLHTFWNNNLCKESAGNTAAQGKILKVINQCQAAVFHFSVVVDTVSSFNGKYHVIPECMCRMGHWSNDWHCFGWLSAMVQTWEKNKTKKKTFLNHLISNKNTKTNQ